MNLSLTTETFGNQSHTWLGSARGTNSTRSVTAKVSTFTSGTHYPSGYFPDGTAFAVPTSGANSGYAVPLVTRVNEVKTVTITGTPTGGTVTLTLDGETTGTIAYNASAATVLAALEALSNVDAGAVVVTGGPGPGTAWVVTFSGPQYLGADVPTMTGSAASLTGGTSPAITITTSTGGGSGVTDGSDLLAGFLYLPVAVATGQLYVPCALLDTGRIINASLPIPLAAAQQATNPRFAFI